jgi:hypothetical protein
LPVEASRKRIKKFKEDVDFLDSKGIKRDEIAQRMKMAPENFSAYYNETIPITNPFLGKFYDVCPELEPDTASGLALDKGEGFRIHDAIVEKLINGQNRLIEGHHELIQGQNRLIDKNALLVDYNQRLMDLIISQRKETEKPDPSKVPKKGD